MSADTSTVSGLGPPDSRQEGVEQLLFARIVTAAGVDPAHVSKAEADSLKMLLAAIHGVVAFAVNRTIPPKEAERYVSLIVQAGVRGYRELMQEGLLGRVGAKKRCVRSTAR